MEPFLPCAQSSSSSSSKSSLSSSSSSSSCSFLNLIPSLLSSAFVRSRLITLSPVISRTYHRTKKGHNINHSTNYVKLSTCIFIPDKYLKHLDTPHVYRNVKFPSLGRKLNSKFINSMRHSNYILTHKINIRRIQIRLSI